MMSANTRILKALKFATTELGSSLESGDKKADNPLEDIVWHAAAEVEYALFIFSISTEEEIKKSKWKIDPSLKKAEVEPILAEAQNLLEEAEKHVKNENLLDAYKDASIARDYLLRVQKRFTKKRREALKKKNKKK